MKKSTNTWTFLTLPLVTMMTLPAYAQLVVSDTLTGASSNYPWVTTDGACLTAGNNSGTIPACVGLPYYNGKTLVGGVTGRLPDPVGQGALRLTNGDTTTGSNGNNNTGSVISQNPFPTNQGVQVTFSTVTYGGNAYKNSKGVKSGADGIAFFLMDGAKPPAVGAFGGSLGYSCSQNKNPAQGVDGGYLAVAIDEYGNFSNPGDDTATGPGSQPGYIVVRGSGNITYPALNLLNPTLYPLFLSNSDKNTAVQHTCGTGLLQDWSGGSDNGNALDDNNSTIPVNDYNYITSQKVSVPIFNQEAINLPLRANANVLTYQLSITQDGFLSLAYSANGGAITQVLNKLSITANNGPLPASFRFGFTSGTGGGSNVHEITCFKAAPLNLASDSAATNIQQSAKVQIGSQVYFAFYHPLNSWGELAAKSLLADASGNLSIATSANWDANCVLTGGTCANTGTPTVAEAPASRTILSWNDASSTGVSFQYGSLSGTQQTAIGGGTDGSIRVSYLRGDRSNEVTAPGVGVFRKRDGVLGDIVNSSPTWVGGPGAPYTNAGNDLLRNTNIAEFGTSYTNFSTTYQNRTNIVYVGANDGLLHGFRSNSPNDGNEMLAYMPSSVVNTIHSANTALDFSSPQYGHNSFVDASPGVGDLYYSGAWHTWLTGGLGAGGNANGTINDTTTIANGTLYALDITDPSTFSESAAANIVKGEWNSSNLTCSNVSNCKDSLGSVYGTPIIRLLHDGNWAVIFGNGRNSKTGTAGVFIMSVDKTSGNKTFRFLDTGKSNTTNRNGLDFVVSADLDGDHVTDYLYGGDAQGNLWRFDLTNTNPSNWAAGANPVFSTPGGQPISTAPTVSAVYGVTGLPRVILNFATGRQFPQTLSSAQTFASGTQSIYGIWDSDLTAWNAISQVKYSALPSGQSFTSSDLVTQTISTFSAISGSISGYRTVTQNPVCWKGSTTFGCSGGTQFGWKMDLPGASEQVIYSPVILNGSLFVNTIIPGVTQSLSCTTQPASGFTMGLAADSGTAPISSFYNTGLPTTTPIAGLGLSWFGTPALVNTGKKSYLIGNTSGAGSGTNNNNCTGPNCTNPCPGPNCVQTQPRKNGSGGRLTWVKLR